MKKDRNAIEKECTISPSSSVLLETWEKSKVNQNRGDFRHNYDKNEDVEFELE